MLKEIPPTAYLAVPSYEIELFVQRIARNIANSTVEKPSILVAVMNGATCFAADLLREMSNQGLDLEFFALSVKRDQQGYPNIKNSHPLVYRHAVSGKRALIVDTICDSGATANMVVQNTLRHGDAKWVDYACLLCRDPLRLPRGFDNYVGLSVEGSKDYFFGYGMDRNGSLRGLPSIYAESPSSTIPESLLAS